MSVPQTTTFRHPELKQRPLRRAVLRSPDGLGPAWRSFQQEDEYGRGQRYIRHGRQAHRSQQGQWNQRINTAGEKLGSVYDVMIDKATGKSEYAIMTSVGSLAWETAIIPCHGTP